VRGDGADTRAGGEPRVCGRLAAAAPRRGEVRAAGADPEGSPEPCPLQRPRAGGASPRHREGGSR